MKPLTPQEIFAMIGDRDVLIVQLQKRIAELESAQATSITYPSPEVVK